jgi:hypothetical protein
MGNKELVKALEQLKTLEAAGSPSKNFVDKNKDILMMQIKNSSTEPKRVFGIAYTRRMIETVLPQGFYRFAVRPVMTALVMLGVAFGTWAATVSASYGTLPGDALYSLKMIAEKTQLTLTPSGSKPSLRVEFANRRLEEIAKIAESPSIKDRNKRTKEAVKNFTFHIAAVKLSLEDLENNNERDKAMEVAQMVTRKTEEYGTVLEKAKVEAPEEVKKEMDRATNLVDDAAIKAVGVIIKNTTESSSTIISSMEDKVRTVEGRVTQMEAAPNTGDGVAQEAKEALNEVKEALENNNLSTAVDKLVEVKNLVNSAMEIAENNSTSTPSTSTSTIINK